MASSSQEASSIARGRVESKDLITGGRIGKGRSGIIYETTWSGMRVARKHFLGMKKNVFEKEVTALVQLSDERIAQCYCWTIDKSSFSVLLEYVDDNLRDIVLRRRDAHSNCTITPATSGSTSSSKSRLIEMKDFFRRDKNTKIWGLVVKALPSDQDRGIRSCQPFKLHEAVDIMLQIALGMKYLHEKGIPHGDLKPNNVMILRMAADRMMVKLTDYGLFGTKKSGHLVPKSAQYSEVLSWKAPELFDELLGPTKRDSEDDPWTDSDDDKESEEDLMLSSMSLESYKRKIMRADFYSFAVTCSYILSGEVPYKDYMHCDDLRWRIQPEKTPYWREPNPEPSLRPNLYLSSESQGLRDIIVKSWDIDIAKRPASFSEICATLGSMLFQLQQVRGVEVWKAAPANPNKVEVSQLKSMKGSKVESPVEMSNTLGSKAKNLVYDMSNTLGSEAKSPVEELSSTPISLTIYARITKGEFQLIKKKFKDSDLEILQVSHGITIRGYEDQLNQTKATILQAMRTWDPHADWKKI